MNSKRILSLLLAGAMVMALSGCQSDDGAASSQEASAPAGVAVQVEEIVLQAVATENKVSGKVVAESATSIMVGSSAKCTAVYVQAGDMVQAGDKICTLDLASTIANYNAAKINYGSLSQQYADQKAILEKQIAMAEDNVANTKALFEIGAASQLEIDNAELTLQQAQAGKNNALSQLEAGMQQAKASVEQLTMVMEHVDGQGNIIAPVSGILTSLSATENGYVSTSMPVAVIDGAEQMKISVSVSEALVPKLTAGDSVSVVVAAANAAFTGTIRSVEKAANYQTQLYTVTISVPAEVSGLLSGMFADVTFHTDTAENAVVVPSEAILNRSGVQFVYVVENDMAKYVEVTTGLTGSGVTEITSGLSAGQQLVTMGQAYLADGDPVRIVSGEG